MHAYDRQDFSGDRLLLFNAKASTIAFYIPSSSMMYFQCHQAVLISHAYGGAIQNEVRLEILQFLASPDARDQLRRAKSYPLRAEHSIN